MQILSWSAWSAWFFFLILFYVGFSFWNIGETGLEIQTEIPEKAGPRWALLGLSRTHGSVGPRVAPLALSFLCGASLGVFAVLSTCCSPTLVFCLRSYSKTQGNKTLPVWRPGSWFFYSIIKYGCTLQFEGKYMKVNAESKVVMCPKDTVKGDVQSRGCPSQLAFLGVLS